MLLDRVLRGKRVLGCARNGEIDDVLHALLESAIDEALHDAGFSTGSTEKEGIAVFERSLVRIVIAQLELGDVDVANGLAIANAHALEVRLGSAHRDITPEEQTDDLTS